MEVIKQRKHYWHLVPYILIALLAIEDVMLMRQNDRLRTQISDLLGTSVIGTLQPGDHVDAFKVQTLSGEDSIISYDQSMKKYILFVLSPTCPHCERNLSVWALIAHNSHTSRCEAIGVSIFPLEATRNYVEEKKIDWNIVIDRDTSFSRSYKIGSVPQTILVSQSGTIEKVWLGELSPDNVTDIKQTMDKENSSF